MGPLLLVLPVKILSSASLSVNGQTWFIFCIDLDQYRCIHFVMLIAAATRLLEALTQEILAHHAVMRAEVARP